MFNPKLRHLPLAAAALAACAGAHAAYSSPDGHFSLSGFGTLGYARSSTDDALYNYRGQGGGADKNGSIGTDTKAGVQGTYRVTPTLQATAQVMSKLSPLGDYGPSLEWAFAKWQAAPSVSVRVGRLGGPFFMLSDFRDVNYAVTSVRPSMDVYGQVPVTNYEGADATYQFNVGDVTLNTSIAAGRSNTKYALDLPGNRSPSDLKLTGMTALNILAEFDNGLMLRFGRTQGKLAISSASSLQIAQYSGVISAAETAVGDPNGTASQYAAVASALSGAASDASFTGIGFAYDQGNWVASGEYTKRKTKGFVSDTTGYATLLGYRVGKFTPFVGVSRVKTDERSSPIAPGVVSAAAKTALTASLGATGTALGNAGPTLLAGSRFISDTQNIDERTTSIGVRWDATASVAVKTQFDRITKPAGGTGLFLVPLSPIPAEQSWVNSARSINILSVSVDYVF